VLSPSFGLRCPFALSPFHCAVDARYAPNMLSRSRNSLRASHAVLRVDYDLNLPLYRIAVCALALTDMLVVTPSGLVKSTT